jgi:Protein of unknown function (DUF3891)
MIIRETNDSFIMIKQHDHAFLSGEIVKHFDASLLRSNAFRDEHLYASYQHDRSWIGLDKAPVWNDAVHRPFTFSDYPLVPKLVFYERGLDEDLLQEHFTLLQFSDDFSLFMCLNRPGVAKEEEHPWFRNGFKHTEPFNHTEDPLEGKWTGPHAIGISGAPFKQPFTVELHYKEVSKASILQEGITKAYASADISTHSITISSAGPDRIV